MFVECVPVQYPSVLPSDRVQTPDVQTYVVFTDCMLYVVFTEKNDSSTDTEHFIIGRCAER